MKKEISQIRRETSHIGGWLHDREGALLYRLARRCQGRGCIVEIGSWRGKSTTWLSRGSLAASGARVYAIDPHPAHETRRLSSGRESDTFRDFLMNIRKAGTERVVTPIVKPSAEAADEFDEPIELIFIDGSHTYEDALADIVKWSPKIIDGGTIAIHDSTNFPEVVRATKETVYKGRGFRNIRTCRSITYATKTSDNSIMNRAANRGALTLTRIREPVIAGAYHTAVRFGIVTPIKDPHRQDEA